MGPVVAGSGFNNLFLLSFPVSLFKHFTDNSH